MRGVAHPSARDPDFLRMYPAERHRGQKKDHLEWIMAHVPGWAQTFGDAFGGSGIVGWHAKLLGLEVATNEIMAFGHARARALIANGTVALDERDLAVLDEPNPSRLCVSREWYGAALGAANAEWLDNLAANLPLLLVPVKRDVAAYVAVMCLMERMNYPQVTFRHDRGFTGKRYLAGFDWRTEFRNHALRIFPRLLHDNGRTNRACRGDALSFIRSRRFDCLYLDPPFASSVKYEHDLAFYDKLCLILAGRHHMVETPHNAPVDLPPHTCFYRRDSSLMGLCRAFRAAAATARRVIFSYNSTSAIGPEEIVRDGERIYGRLVAREERPAPLRSRRPNRPECTSDVLLVFDRCGRTGRRERSRRSVTGCC